MRIFIRSGEVLSSVDCSEDTAIEELIQGQVFWGGRALRSEIDGGPVRYYRILHTRSPRCFTRRQEEEEEKSLFHTEEEST